MAGTAPSEVEIDVVHGDAAVSAVQPQQRERWGQQLPWENWKGFLGGSKRALFLTLLFNILLQTIGGAIFSALEYDTEKVPSQTLRSSPTELVDVCL